MNDSANPTAIFLPNVHMSSLLGTGADEARAHRRQQGRDTDQGVGASVELDDAAAQLAARRFDVALEAREGERDRLRSAAQHEPARRLVVGGAAENSREAC